MTDTQRRSLQLVDVVEPHVYDSSGSAAWSSAAARRAAGLDDYPSIRYRALEEESILVATGITEAIDGRSDPHCTRVRSDRERVSFSRGDLQDAFGRSGEDVTQNGLRLAVFASDGVIAFCRVDDLDSIDLDNSLIDDIRSGQE